MISRVVCLAAALTPGVAFAQPSIDEVDRYGWSENGGWLNWAPEVEDPSPGRGMTFHQNVDGSGYLSGYIWWENFGWIHLGDGTPADGSWYANDVGEDSGVNYEASGLLRGLGWSENAGWINFDTESALSGFGQHAWIDFAALRFRGYLWNENFGWINLDDSEKFVALACIADINNDGFLDNGDISEFIALFLAGNLTADVNGDGFLDNGDISTFISLFLAGC